MSSAPVEFFTLRLNPGEIYHLDTIRDIQITNVSYSNPEELSGKNRSVLRVHYAGHPAFDSDSDDDEEDSDEEITSEESDSDNDDAEDDDDDESGELNEDEIAEILNQAGADDDSDSEEDSDEDSDDEPVFTEEDSYVVCSLIPERVEQVTLNLQVSEEEEVGLSVSGDEPVDIIGNYLLPSSLNNLAPEDYEDLYNDISDDDEISDDEDADETGNRFAMIRGDEDGDEDDDEELDSDDEDEDDEDEDDEDDDEDEELEELDEDDLDDDAEEIIVVPSKKRSAADIEEEEPKLSRGQRKRLNKKLKAEASAAAAPSKKEDEKTTLPSGLTIEDKKIGTGPTAKHGQRVSMRYVGKLMNGSVFDSNTKGKPFTFRLGKGEVIKGWDQGVKGMQVGGERRLVCPPSLAYGRSKLPGIPANSTLIFDVKLLEAK